MTVILDEQILRGKYKQKISSTRGRIDKNGDSIEMLLTYEEWKQLWTDFGRLPGYPYVVSRKDDIGHYEINNVFIQHCMENSTQAAGRDTDVDRLINKYCLKTGYKRSYVKRAIKRGELKIEDLTDGK
jgi:hypothetical protein